MNKKFISIALATVFTCLVTVKGNLFSANVVTGKVDANFKAEAEYKEESKPKTIEIGLDDYVIPKKEEEVAPVDNSYGWPTNSNYYITTYSSGAHDGIDIAGTGYGSPVYAPTSGVIEVASATSMNGNYIIIHHDDERYSLYAHLSGFNVVVGTRVKKGDVIGFVGSTGNSTGPHLHYCIWTGFPYRWGYALNPYDFY